MMAIASVGARRWITGVALLAGAFSLRVLAAPSSKPASQPMLKEGWEEIDQRLVFLTVQLSTIESSIEATDKALKMHGYQKIAQEAAAEAARQKNELMDRKGGGPVPWQDFYGKTAEKFFYHPDDPSTLHVNPRAVAQRPPQFDYIYRANEENRQKAENDAARIGTKIDDLLAYRKQLETEQTALWSKIAFRAISSLELSNRPIYRPELTVAGTDEAAKQSLEAAKAAVEFMRAIDAELTFLQKGLDDQKEAFDHLVKTTLQAREQMQSKFAKLPTLASSLANPRDPFGQFSRLAKRLEDSAQNLADAYRLAVECDSKDDLSGKRSYRGQMQQMIFDYASTLAAADQSLGTAMAAWKITPNAAQSAAPEPVAVTGVDAIPVRLEAAKAQHEKDLAAARRILVNALDARLNASADAGDLAGVQLFQAAKLRAARDGTLAEEVKDEAAVAAKKEMDLATTSAHAKLAAVYRETISSYTKARKITEALAL